jgi:hypothetical protein
MLASPWAGSMPTRPVWCESPGVPYFRDMVSGGLIEKGDIRTKFEPPHSGTLIAYLLPDALDLEAIEFLSDETRLIITSGPDFSMDLSEHRFGSRL